MKNRTEDATNANCKDSSAPLADVGIIGIEDVGHPRTAGWTCVCPECVGKRKAVRDFGDALLLARSKMPPHVWQEIFSKANLAISKLLQKGDGKR